MSIRKSAKQVVTKFVNNALLKIEICSTGTEPVRVHLGAYRSIAREMGWTDLVSRIDRGLKLDTSHVGGQDLSNEEVSHVEKEGQRPCS
jgi:hypothetical protein